MMFLLLGAALAADVEVSHRVDAVTVHPRAARVVRLAKASVPAGRTELVFAGLPDELDVGSLTARGESTAGATILGLDARLVRSTEERDRRVAELREQRLALADQIIDLRDRIEQAEREETWLGQVKPLAQNNLESGLLLRADTAAQLADIAEQLGEGLSERSAERRDAERLIAELQDQVGVLDRDIKKLVSGDGLDTQQVRVAVLAPKAGSVTVALEYLVSGVSWSPRYDLRYRTKDDTIELGLGAEVRQRTGEDWSEVELHLSTADPGADVSPPELEAFWLREQASIGSRAVADGGAVWTFHAAERDSVLADGSTRTVPLELAELTPEVVHRVVPRAQEAAWLTARVTNETPWPWQGGPVSAFLDGAFIGEGQLRATARGEEVDLSFGLDDRVVVERTRLTDLELGTKVLGNRERARWGYRTRVTNRTGGAIQLEVTEQVPASAQADFEVVATTTPETTVPADGVFTWEAELADGAEQDFVLDYEVSWPVGERPILLD